ncbi:MAG: dihydroorotate dehydrogenase [Defluviitaleaceae bacterium]|nr:dihydroorotate dehydrogenase [Defluviitaleaceae bacterium]
MIKIANKEWKTPVTVASGTFASGREYGEFINLSHLGAVTTKGVSDVPWSGNPAPRVAETYGGMLNSIGVQNVGVKMFIEKDLEFLQNTNTNIIVNICGHTIDDYLKVIEALDDHGGAHYYELNVSCPNIKEGGISFGVNAKETEKLTSACRKITKTPLIVKLSPNVTDITEIAKAAEEAGADALSLINTLKGIAIDINSKKPFLGGITGGLSGPAIKPIAVRMVYETYKAVKIPIIGMGGIFRPEDAIEFILAGASAVAIGTANFSNPRASIEIINGINEYLEKNNTDMQGIIGAAT